MLGKNQVRRPGLRALIVVMAVAGLALVGCGRQASVHVVHPAAKVVVIEKGHKHYKRCGHFKHKNKWYYAHEHVHQKYCGHEKVKGAWVVK